MDAHTIFRRLAAHPAAVLMGLGLALLVGMLFAFNLGFGGSTFMQPRQYHAGVASASVLLDSEKSQVSDLGDPKVVAGQAGLLARSQTLSNLLISSPLREQIAAIAGIPAQRLITKLSSRDPNQAITSPETIGVTVRESDRTASVLNVTLSDQVPIITFNARAPSAAVAAKLSNAAVSELTSYLDRTASAAAVPDFRKLVVKPLGKAQSSTVTRGTGLGTAIIAALFVFLTWCAAILGIESQMRHSREVRLQALDREGFDTPWLTARPEPPELPRPQHEGRVA